MYPKELVDAIESELTDEGFKALKSAQQIADHFSNHSGTTLLVMNSMCGCAGPEARRGIVEALANTTYHPDHLITVFPGVDEEITAAIQPYIKPYPLSAPAVALVKDKEVIYFMERHQIKGNPAETIREELLTALENYVA